ncbi:MAG: hypothetical protein WDA18_07110 [Candidatus Ratteibacteria bacterium]|jgi:hypothetical protein
MRRMIVLSIFLFFIQIPLLFSADQELVEEKLSFSGYYKGLGSMMDFSAFETNYCDLMNRLRLSWEYSPSSSLYFRMDYDLETHIGDFLKGAEYQSMEQMKPKQWLDLESSLIDEEGFLLRHSLYRAFFRLSFPSADIHIGRFAFDWGTGRAWNPTDPFFTFNPLLIETEERVGTDGISLDIPIGSSTLVSGAITGTSNSGTGYAVRYRSHAFETDFSCMAYKDNRFSRYGIDFSRAIGKNELHGAFAIDTQDHTRTLMVLGLERTFTNTLKISAEYYRNGHGTTEKSEYAWADLLEGKRYFLAKNYAFLGLEYEITPLLKFQHASVFNLDDGSIYWNPSLQYSLTSNADLRGGWAGFSAGNEKEFFLYPDIWYLEFQLFF